MIAMRLRRWLSETPLFEEMKRRAKGLGGTPLRAVLQNQRRPVAAAILCTWMLTAAIVVVILMTPSMLAARTSGLPPGTLQLANLAATAALCVSTVGVGAASDLLGVRRAAVPVMLLLIGSTYALYLSAEHALPWVLPLYVLAGVGAGGVALTPIAMVRAFPTDVRFSGVSFSYNIAYAVMGGLTPLLSSWLMHINPIGPAHYVAAAALAGLGGIFLAPLTYLGGADSGR